MSDSGSHSKPPPQPAEWSDLRRARYNERSGLALADVRDHMVVPPGPITPGDGPPHWKCPDCFTTCNCTLPEMAHVACGQEEP